MAQPKRNKNSQTQQLPLFKNKGLFALLSLLLLFTSYSRAQFISAQIGVDGLTCSACTRSVEMSIRKLNFVQDVQMNLEHTEGTISFKSDSIIDIGKLAQAIINAGFSVRYLTAVFKTDTAINVSENYCLEYKDVVYQFISVKPGKLQNNITLTFIGKQFLPAKDLKKWKDNLKATNSGKKTYFVTL